jgi:hypothetical protein
MGLFSDVPQNKLRVTTIRIRIRITNSRIKHASQCEVEGGKPAEGYDFMDETKGGKKRGPWRNAARCKAFIFSCIVATGRVEDDTTYYSIHTAYCVCYVSSMRTEQYTHSRCDRRTNCHEPTTQERSSPFHTLSYLISHVWSSLLLREVPQYD